jgi:hypothetical protein
MHSPRRLYPALALRVMLGLLAVSVAGQPVARAQPTYAPGSTTMLFVSCVGWPGGNPYYPCLSQPFNGHPQNDWT